MGKKILVVEDERNIVDILTFNLQREGYDTLEALDGAGLTENVDGIRLDDLSYLKMDYIGRFTVWMAYGADYEWELQKLTATLADEKIQDNMTGTIDLRLNSEQVRLIQNVR